MTAKQVFGDVGNPFSKATTSKEIIDLIQKHEIEFVDVRFCDLIGHMQHFSITSRYLDQDAFDLGLPFDGSSVRGYQSINESDLALLPDPTSVTIDPFRTRPTIIINATVHQPLSLDLYSRDPRTIARKAEKYVQDSGIADTAFIGPEAEFFIFDSARFGQNAHSAFYEIDSIAGAWNAGREFEADGGPNLAYKPGMKGGYFVLPPADKFQDLRSDMTAQLEEVGVHVEVQHHEVGTAGQGEIDMKYDTILNMGDKMQMYKYVVKNVAAKAGYTVTFMPKPLFEDNGSGMHVHQSLWKDGVNLFHEEGNYANLSQMALHYIAGIIEHGPALCAFTNPTTNSYRRLTPGYEAPINLVYSQRNRSACLRIPLVRNTATATRVEYRTPDPTANPYLAYSALVMAGLDGIKRKLMPPEPADFDLFEASEDVLSKIKTVPSSLEGALDALKADHQFLLEGDVFTQDVIDTWLEEKSADADQVRLRPHPWEFQLYYNY
ncbi:MAG: type I glutamate--ammonia ligase [Acidimicrobiia bacterium]